MYEIKNNNFNQIAAALAHEVKNPVALIKANVELLEHEYEDKILEKNFNIIKRQLNKINFIISDFIQLTRPSSSDEKEKIYLSDIIYDLIEDYDITPKGKDISFKTVTSDEEISITANYSKICILLFNIYKNAVEAISNSGNILTTINEDENAVTVSIKDDGEGLNSEIENKIGTPFITTKKEGSGLGISICKNIVEENNATFEIFNNTDSNGCTVRIRFLK